MRVNRPSGPSGMLRAAGRIRLHSSLENAGSRRRSTVTAGHGPAAFAGDHAGLNGCDRGAGTYPRSGSC
jgi:hypothetical protein